MEILQARILEWVAIPYLSDPGIEPRSPTLQADSLPPEPPGKPIALTIWIFVGKVMSQLCNTLSRFVTAFLPRSKHLLILMTESLGLKSN